jgi:hypothetical protein
VPGNRGLNRCQAPGTAPGRIASKQGAQISARHPVRRYKQAIINQDQIPGGCNCRDNCNRSIMAPAASNTCQDETNNVRVTVVHQGIRYSVPVGCYCNCSDTSWTGGVSTCTWDNDKFELEAPQYARSAQVVAGVE